MRGAFFVFLTVLAFASGALAQDDRASARAHFERGVELFDEGRYVQALAEFEEAYRVSPRPAVLYNIAQLHAELGRSVEAADTYERFLAESTDLDADLRAEVEAAMRRERARIGTVTVTTSAPGAHVALDDVEVGIAPLGEAVRVSAGEHVISAQADGYETVRHRFRIAGGQTIAITLSLVASGTIGSSIRVLSRLPGVDIRVDGTSLGLTPLDSTVPLAPGPHLVEGVREGYTRFAQNVDVGAGSETTVSIVVERDPSAAAASHGTLVITLPDATSHIRIDGELVLSEEETFDVAIGLHDVEVQVADRETVTTRIDVEAGAPYALEPVWTWTPDAREARLAAAADQRVVGIALVLGGVGAMLLGGAAIGIGVGWRDDHIRPFGDTISQCSVFVGVDPTAAGAAEAPCRAGLERFHGSLAGLDDEMVAGIAQRFVAQNQSLYEDHVTALYALYTGGGVLLGLGVVGVIAGAVHAATAPDERAIDRAARASLAPTFHVDFGLGSLTLSGTF